MSDSQRSRGCQFQQPASDCVELVEKRIDCESRHQKQTPLRRLGRRLPRKSPARITLYGAIGLGYLPVFTMDGNQLIMLEERLAIMSEKWMMNYKNCLMH